VKQARLQKICTDELGLELLASPAKLRRLIVEANFYWYIIRPLKRKYWRLVANWRSRLGARPNRF